MDEFFKWLSGNRTAATTLIVSFGFWVVAMVLIYLVAFLQGREISFWPPKIGKKADKTDSTRKKKASGGTAQQETPPAEAPEKQREEMVARISSLERESADLRARLAFEEQINPTDALAQDVATHISNLFLTRDKAVSDHDGREFLETQLNKQEIPQGSSKGYISCSKMTTSVLKIVAAKKSGKGANNVDYVVLVREDYEHNYRYSHSGYIVYHLAKTKEGLKIVTLKSLD